VLVANRHPNAEEIPTMVKPTSAKPPAVPAKLGPAPKDPVVRTMHGQPLPEDRPVPTPTVNGKKRTARDRMLGALAFRVRNLTALRAQLVSTQDPAAMTAAGLLADAIETVEDALVAAKAMGAAVRTKGGAGARIAPEATVQIRPKAAKHYSIEPGELLTVVSINGKRAVCRAEDGTNWSIPMGHLRTSTVQA
jgi:hypothetical protein